MILPFSWCIEGSKNPLSEGLILAGSFSFLPFREEGSPIQQAIQQTKNRFECPRVPR
jgi:hypothetical protein